MVINNILDLIFIKIIVIYNSINKIIKFAKNMYIKTIYKCENIVNFVRFFKEIFIVFVVIIVVSLIFFDFDIIKRAIINVILITIYEVYYIAILEYFYIVCNNIMILFSGKFLFNLLIVIINIEFKLIDIVMKIIQKHNFDYLFITINFIFRIFYSNIIFNIVVLNSLIQNFPSFSVINTQKFIFLK